MRRLIVNADDFGLTPGVNRGIVETHGHGIVTSATLMANGPAFDDAVRLSQSSPRLSVGCHVVLVDGAPLLEKTQIPSLLVGPDTRPCFADSASSFAVRALTGRLDPAQIEAEATAQIRRLQSAGISVSHLDTHKHTHLFPQVLRPLLRAANNCGVRAIRNPFEPVGKFLARPRLWVRAAQLAALSVLANTFWREVRHANLIAPDGAVGIVATGVLTEELFQRMIETLPDGTWELVCHPGYNDDQLRSARTRLRESRLSELQLLTSPRSRDLLVRAGVQLISYRDLL